MYNNEIMLKFNPKKMMAMRGIEKTTAFLVNLGMGYPAASVFLKSKSQSVKINTIEKLCLALNCTPNDLFEWTPDKNTVVPESHSLFALEKSGSQSIQQLVKDIPSDKLKLIESLLEELKQ